MVGSEQHILNPKLSNYCQTIESPTQPQSIVPPTLP